MRALPDVDVEDLDVPALPPALAIGLHEDDPIRNMRDELQEFCRREGIMHDARQALARAREHFPLAAEPSFELVRDPDNGSEWLSIILAVPRSTRRGELLDRYDAFLDSWLPRVPANRERIRVSFSRV